MQLFEIIVVPLQLTRLMIRDRYESKRENGWLNLFKTEISGHQAKNPQKLRTKQTKTTTARHYEAIVSLSKTNY